MEGEGNDCAFMGEDSHPGAPLHGNSSILSSTFFLDHVGEVSLVFNSDGLFWEPINSPNASAMVEGEVDGDCGCYSNGNKRKHSLRKGILQLSALEMKRPDGSICFGIKSRSKAASEIKLSDIYAVELSHHGPIHITNLPHATEHLLFGNDIKLYRFIVHGFIRSKNQLSQWIPTTYTFGHKDFRVCEMWVNKLNAFLDRDVGRPRNLLVFVNPKSGKRNGCKTWEAVGPIFSRAKVETKVILTKRAGQALDVMSSMTNKELNNYDGVVAVFLAKTSQSSKYQLLKAHGTNDIDKKVVEFPLFCRFKAPNPPTPSDFVHPADDNGDSSVLKENERAQEIPEQCEDKIPFISSEDQSAAKASYNISGETDDEFHILNQRFRIGIIPAGSTDAIVMCTTGTRDAVTSALHIVLGKRVRLDIAQIVRWKATPRSEIQPYMRYTASFAGSYEAEIAYLDVGSDEPNLTSKRRHEDNMSELNTQKSERRVCCVDCKICNENSDPTSTGISSLTPHLYSEGGKWKKSKGRFLSVGAALISCRNDKAPDGLVVDAHLSDGFLHLILIRECPHASYLRHLIQLTKSGGSPLNFQFVEHHKTPTFTFTSMGKESVWNLDGEIFEAHQLSAQVFRGLVCLFASGPQV
ncbi:ceramide kinase isoform X5 [Arachis hypogaea]|uniref:ceramide kinase isoform X5 n=1 Tax=Arachis hypogaea TaxID=3818 RepID=UPI000DEE026B|nr:ceramide kinase isoform X4 [Arachis hypogaea]